MYGLLMLLVSACILPGPLYGSPTPSTQLLFNVLVSLQLLISALADLLCPLLLMFCPSHLQACGLPALSWAVPAASPGLRTDLVDAETSPLGRHQAWENVEKKKSLLYSFWFMGWNWQLGCHLLQIKTMLPGGECTRAGKNTMNFPTILNVAFCWLVGCSLGFYKLLTFIVLL